MPARRHTKMEMEKKTICLITKCIYQTTSTEALAMRTKVCLKGLLSTLLYSITTWIMRNPLVVDDLITWRFMFTMDILDGRIERIIEDNWIFKQSTLANVFDHFGSINVSNKKTESCVLKRKSVRQNWLNTITLEFSWEKTLIHWVIQWSELH